MLALRRFFALSLLAVFFCSTVYAEEVKYLTSPATGRVLSIVVEELGSPDKGAPISFDPVYVAERFLESYGGAFGLKHPLKELVLTKQEKDSLGMTHLRYAQMYNEKYRVFGAEIIVHIGSDGRVKSANGSVGVDINLPIKPALKPARALRNAKREFNAENIRLAPETKAKPSLLVLQPSVYDGTSTPRAYLVYEVRLMNRLAWVDTSFFIDAFSGDLRFRLEHVRGLSRRVYDCSAQPEIDGCGAEYLVHYSQGRPPWTPPPESYYFGCRDPYIVEPCPHGPNPRYLPEESFDSNNAFDLLADAHAYYQAKFSRNGSNGQGGNTNWSVYPSTMNLARTYLNWLSSWAPDCLEAKHWHSHGEGFCKGLVFPDVVAHEYAHGLSITDPLTYSGQSGALDESNSDITGDMFEYWLTGDSDWLAGGQVIGVVPRSLSYPPSFISWVTGRPFPDRFNSDDFYCGSLDNYGVHVNSTVPSKGLYLATMGGQFNGCTISGIGREKVEQILYRARIHYYEPSVTFNQAYVHLIQACNDLYGAGSDDCRNVTRALQAVEMDQAGYCRPEVPPHPATCQCEDSDGGINPDVAGTVVSQYHEYHDFCILRCSVFENYCENYTRQHEVIDCAYGCANGACLPPGGGEPCGERLLPKRAAASSKMEYSAAAKPKP